MAGTSPAMTLLGLCVLSSIVPSEPARAQSVEDFYRGKTINLIIGYSVGGGYDLYGRLVSRHIGKHIPGRPAIVPQNMTGAGSLRAAQYIYLVAPKDGTTFGTFGRTNAVTLAMERGEVDGLCGLSWSTMKARHQQWMTAKKLNIIIQAALRKQPELADVPLASDLTQDREKLQILKLF